MAAQKKDEALNLLVGLFEQFLRDTKIDVPGHHEEVCPTCPSNSDNELRHQFQAVRNVFRDCWCPPDLPSSMVRDEDDDDDETRPGTIRDGEWDREVTIPAKGDVLETEWEALRAHVAALLRRRGCRPGATGWCIVPVTWYWELTGDAHITLMGFDHALRTQWFLDPAEHDDLINLVTQKMGPIFPGCVAPTIIIRLASSGPLVAEPRHDLQYYFEPPMTCNLQSGCCTVVCILFAVASWCLGIGAVDTVRLLALAMRRVMWNLRTTDAARHVHLIAQTFAWQRRLSSKGATPESLAPLLVRDGKRSPSLVPGLVAERGGSRVCHVVQRVREQGADDTEYSYRVTVCGKNAKPGLTVCSWHLNSITQPAVRQALLLGKRGRASGHNGL